jgi:hypothetical protein
MFGKRSAADDLKDALVFPDAYGRKPDQGLSAAGVLQQQLESPEPSWRERVMGWVRAENEAAKAHSDRKHASDLPERDRGVQSTVEALKEALGEPEQHDVPGLADQRLLQIAAGSQDAPRSVREEIARLLHDYRQAQQ